MSTSEVMDLIGALTSGDMTLNEVAERFRHRSWAHTRRPLPQSYPELAAQAQLDPKPDVPDSYYEVTDAVAESIRAEALGSAGNGAE